MEGAARVELLRVLVLAAALFGVSLLVGVPFGYFQAELTATLGSTVQGVLAFGMDALALGLVCVAVSAKWPRNAFARVVASFILVEFISLGASRMVGAYLPPVVLLILESLLSLAVALVGAMVGKRLSRSR